MMEDGACASYKRLGARLAPGRAAESRGSGRRPFGLLRFGPLRARNSSFSPAAAAARPPPLRGSVSARQDQLLAGGGGGPRRGLLSLSGLVTGSARPNQPSQVDPAAPHDEGLWGLSSASGRWRPPLLPWWAWLPVCSFGCSDPGPCRRRYQQKAPMASRSAGGRGHAGDECNVAAGARLCGAWLSARASALATAPHDVASHRVLLTLSGSTITTTRTECC